MSIVLKDLNSLRLSRDAIIRWLEDTRFQDVMIGLYCRVVVRDATSKKYYRIALVKGIRILNPKEKQAMLQLEHGGITKEYGLDYISNGNFTDQEFEQFLQSVIDSGNTLVTKSEVTSRIASMREFITTVTNEQNGQQQQEQHQQSSDYHQQRRRDSSERNRHERRPHQDQYAQRDVHPRDRAPRDDGEVRDLRHRLQTTNSRLSQKERQLSEMHEDITRYERDLSKKNAELRTLETSLTSERDSKKLLTVKIKEMDLVIQQQTELIQLMQTQLQKERDLQLTISKKRTALANRLRPVESHNV
eukprot:TRINITY_DN16783_c0_g1_i1.p1 TRINITY_DN16783_c0_g1~~TRINITY_DN16783_c0_g1_i1.p1  ORF type:complete len:314 (+),score=65.44 TRINITY_DN16783_c0_g1_i1:36-944(+)